MTSVTIPRSIRAAENKLAELGDIAVATEWHRAAIVATYVEQDKGRGGRQTSSSGHLESARAFAGRGIIGLQSATSVLLYANAWLDKFPRPKPGSKVVLPDDPWPPTRTGTDGFNSEEGAAKTIEKIVAKHGAKVLAPAIKNSDEVAAAAAQGLVETGNVSRLSSATAAAARNRQVERNRVRATSGDRKGRSVTDPKPSLSPDVAAFLGVRGLADALRSLVTTFPQEWAGLSDEAKSADFIGVCEETLDKIDIATANCRNLISGGISDSDIERLLNEVS